MEAYDKVASVVRSFELGNLVAEPVAVAGGRAHRLWRVQTEGGTFALKALNPQLTGSPAILELIRDKIRLELVCLEAGVRGPEPLSGPDGDYLLQPQADRWWRCHRWVEGDHRDGHQPLLISQLGWAAPWPSPTATPASERAQHRLRP